MTCMSRRVSRLPHAVRTSVPHSPLRSSSLGREAGHLGGAGDGRVPGEPIGHRASPATLRHCGFERVAVPSPDAEAIIKGGPCGLCGQRGVSPAGAHNPVLEPEGTA